MGRQLSAALFLWTVYIVLAPSSLALPAPPGSFQEGASAGLPVPSTQRSLLNKYCVTCHNEKAKVAGLMLDRINPDAVAGAAPIWEKVVKKLRTTSMPPAGAPRPSAENYDSLASYLETKLDGELEVHPNPGRPVIHRLNRTEYSNIVRDLLGIDTDAVDIKALLPTDESAQGFDNIGSALAVSPLLMERYLSAARKVTRIAIGDASIRPVFETYTAPRFLMQEVDRMSEDLPFGSRGGMAIRHYFPVEADYTVRVVLQRMARESIRGLLDEPHDMEVSMDGQRLKMFKFGGENKGPFEYYGAGRSGDPAQEEYERTADKDLEVRFHATAGTHLVGVTFPKKTLLDEGPLQPRLTQVEFSQFKGGVPGVGSVIVGGPYDTKGIGDTPSRHKIFVCRPANSRVEEDCARKVLSTIAHRAYRRPVTDQDLAILIGFYKDGRAKGDFEAGIGAAIERILLDPEFLFHIERDPANIAPDTAYLISDLELASRLSFFLWSSMPDDELLNLAEKGRLREPGVLEHQIGRMIADRRSTALVNNFAGQWLLLRNLRSLNPDPDIFPYFDENLREAFVQETELFVDSLIREDRTVTDLLDADYTFVNERLAQHYGIRDVYGSRFRRVTLTDENRRGLLGKGSVLMVTSYANRTAPTLRGKWILDNVLGAPPPPPPPDVPALTDNGAGGKILTMRERMEQHRANPACAVCHNQMDPLGFALENFDGIGRWRTKEGTSPIDSSGVLPGGIKFQGPSELRQLLMGKREQFVTTVTERLLTYAIGRGLEYYDAPAVRKIMHAAKPKDYRWSSIILNIVKSTPFQMRRSQPS
jgi:mono/diheme cytochrome c family protein